MDDVFTCFAIDFFFIEQGVFGLPFGIVFSCFGEEGAAEEHILLFFFGDKNIESVSVLWSDEQIVGLNRRVGIALGVVAKDELVAVEQRLEIEKVVQARGNFFKAGAFAEIIVSEAALQNGIEGLLSACAGDAQIGQFMQASEMVKMIGLKAQNDGDRFTLSPDDHFVFGGKQSFKGLRALL